MKTRLTLRPGQNGTKKLMRQYGDRLLAVRYRYDDRRHLRIKTVELIVDEFPWTPPNPIPAGRQPDERVWIRLDYSERALRASVKEAGGAWDPERRTWGLSLAAVYALSLQSRIVA